MVDSSGASQQPSAGLHSFSRTGSSSFPSNSGGILNKKGKKTVGGFDFTPELQSIAKSILELEMCPPPLIDATKDDGKETEFFDDDESPEDWVPTTNTTKISTTCRLSTVRRALAPMPQEEALEAIRSVLLDRTKNKTTSLVPLSTIKAMSDLISAHEINPTQSQRAYEIRNQLEKALLSSTLNFVEEVQEMTQEEREEAAKFEKRMQRLRMKAEEKKYQLLTENLEKPLDEEMNVKSMTYAASIGLNMIVAPVSFGILAYFVSGMYFYSDSDSSTNPTYPSKDANILLTYKVICAVIAGVLMMFIEMILFVIRSNEMEYYTSKKKKKNLKMYGPFGNKEAAQVAKTRNTGATIAPLTITE